MDNSSAQDLHLLQSPCEHVNKVERKGAEWKKNARLSIKIIL